MKNLNKKAKYITDEVNEYFKSVTINGKNKNLSNNLETITERINKRFSTLKSNDEAIELVKIWTSSEQLMMENWDVAFLLSRYETAEESKLAKEYLGIDTLDKENLYEKIGLLNMRYANYEVRKRVLRYYRKAFGTKQFYKGDYTNVRIDNLNRKIPNHEYLLMLLHDLKNLEDKYRIPIAHAKNEKQLEGAWKDYGDYLLISYYSLLLTHDIAKEEYRMMMILSNLSNVPIDKKAINCIYENKISKKIDANKYLIFFEIVVDCLDEKNSLESRTISKAIKRARLLITFFELEYKKLLALTKKDACKMPFLWIFFQEQLSIFLDLKEVDAKKYELTALYKASISNGSSKSTKNRRIDGVKKRSVHLRTVKDRTIKDGQKLHEKFLEKKSKVEKYSFTQLCKDYAISRETGYKRLYSYYYSVYKKAENKNKGLSEKGIVNKVCTDENIKEKDMVKAINKMRK